MYGLEVCSRCVCLCYAPFEEFTESLSTALGTGNAM